MKALANLGLSLLLTGLVAVAVAVAIIPAATGTKPVTIEANSMQRKLPLGSLVYIAPQPDYAVGDVVTYFQNGNTVTHEITHILPNPATGMLDGTVYETKGTENAEPDVNPLNREHVFGKVLYHTPYMGTVLKVLSAPVVIAFLCLLATGLYLLSPRKGKPLVQRELSFEEAKAELRQPTPGMELWAYNYDMNGDEDEFDGLTGHVEPQELSEDHGPFVLAPINTLPHLPGMVADEPVVPMTTMADDVSSQAQPVA